MRWVTSDTHFSHANIIRLSNRPFRDVDHMNGSLIANWNAVVSPSDTVYHLGDFGLGSWETWENIGRRLNGNKFLITGNHDRTFKVTNKPAYVERFRSEYTKYFVDVYDNLTNLPFAGTTVNMSHFPYDGDHFDEDRFTEARLPDDGTVLVHGHTHASGRISRSKNGTLQIHVGMDAWNWTPVSEDMIEFLIKAGE